jgi:hypothetical protein
VAIQREIEAGASDDDRSVVVELQFRACQRDLQRGSVPRVAHESVGHTMSEWVHRARHTHATRLKTPPSEILHGRLEPRLDDEQRAHESKSADGTG